MELRMVLKHDNNFCNDIFKHGDLNGCITVIDKKGVEDTSYSVTIEQDDLFEDEWTVTVQTLPDTPRSFKFRHYWFKYNSKTGNVAGDPFYIPGLRKRFILIKTP